MAGRSLPIGAHGHIKTKQLATKSWQAQCRFRDVDGVIRQVKRTGRSRSAAENDLQAALAQRSLPTGAGALGPESKVREAAELWFAQRQDELDEGDLAPGTLRVYRSAWRNHVGPALGELRLREVTVARCEAWQQQVRRSRGAAPAKQARAVLSGVLGYAARMGAIPTNPCRDLSRIPGKPRREPRSMTADERTRWLAWMEDLAPLEARLAAAAGPGEVAVAREALRAARAAQRWDVPDITKLMLATGARIGEVLALTWADVSLSARTVRIAAHLVRVEGDGLHRMPGTKRGKGRTVKVPGWAVNMLMERQIAETAGWPVFPDSLRGWRDPSNVLRVLREARDAAGFDWVTSHVFRKTCATLLDEAGLSAREIADVLEHDDPALTMRVYMGRGVVSERSAAALEDLL